MFSFGGQPQQQQTSGLFGQPQPSPSPFGVAPPLPGAQPAATGGGLFGSSTTPTSTSLFGGGQPAQQATAGLFGQPSAAPSPFGQPAATGGLFGQQQPAATGGLFGGQAQPTTSPMPSAFGGLGGAAPFGAPAAATGLGGTAGTSVQKYQTTRDQELNMRLVSITAMDCYKNKSLEELRWEDYQANRTQTGAATGPTSAWGAQPATTSAFGTPAAGGSMFGQQPGAQPTGGLFGTTAPVQPTGGMFGTQPSQPAAGGLFGTSTSQPASTGGMFGTVPSGGGLFGTSAQPAATGGLFGTSAAPSPSPGGLFGTTPSQPTTGTGLFGTSTITQPSAGGGLFGTSATTSSVASGGLFGTSTTAAPSGGLFGTSTTTQPSTGGLFGTSTTQPTGGGLFGTSTTAPAAQSGGGLFGTSTTQAAGGGLFGTSTTTPATGGGLFGTSSTAMSQPAVGSGGLFGAQSAASTGGGLFGTSTTQPASSGGLFGTSTATPSTGGGLFGTSTTAQPATGGGLFGTSTNTGGGLFGASATTPSATGGLFGTSTTQSAGGGLFGTSSSLPSTSTGGLFGTTTTPSTAGGLFGTSTTAAAPAGSGLGFAQGGLFGTPVAPATTATAAAPVPVPRPTGLVTPKPVDKDSLSAFLWKEKTGETPLVPKKKPSAPPSPRTFVPEPGTAALPYTEEKPLSTETTPLRLRQESAGSPVTSPKAPSIVVKPKIVYTTPTKGPGVGDSPKTARSVLPVCANHNLWTKPSQEAMSGMTEQELSRVEHFQIGQYGIGSVTWPGLTDVRFLNIDDIIVFKKGSVTLFPDEDLKPPMGTGLNKTAIIELFVRPKNMDLAKKYEARYIDEMRKLTESNGAEFMSYDLESWRFRVEHFSTWGIDDSMWTKIDSISRTDENAVPTRLRGKNDLSLFSRIEQELFTPDADYDHQEPMEDMSEDMSGIGDESMQVSGGPRPVMYSKDDFVGGLAVAAPTREELKAMGWDLKIMDLFLNQSFRASIGANGHVVFPEHPVVCDTHSVSVTKTRSRSEKFNQLTIRDKLVLLHSSKDNVEHWNELIESMEHGDSSSIKSVVSLIKALLSVEPSPGQDSPSSESGAINTAAFNEWLSKVNGENIRSDPALAFSPAAALCSRHYSPSASELLVQSGHARLALAAAAATDDTSRRLMQEQLRKISDPDPITQQVAAILGGNPGALRNLDWKAELALRYWYCDGDLNGFDPPASSIEWRIIKCIVLGDSSQLLHLIDTNKLSGTELFSIFIALILIRMKKPVLVTDAHFHKIIMACSDYVLSHSVDWQLSPLLLSFLPVSLERTKLIEDIVARNAGKDSSLLVRLKIVDERTVAATKAVKELSDGHADIARTIASKEGISGLIDQK